MSINEYISGAAGGMAGVIVGHPFDTTKIQMQIRTAGGHNLQKSSDAWSSVTAQGLKNGVFRGMLFPVVSYGFLNSAFFGVYGSTIKLLEPDHTVRPTNFQVFQAGCVAGTVQLVMACPVEVVKCTLQAQIPLTITKSLENGAYAEPVQPRTYYRGPIQCTRAIYHSIGVRGFYKGFWTMFLRDVPSSGLYLLVYEGLHKFMTHHGMSDKKGVLAAIVAGGFAGSISWLVVMPLDFVKSRLQIDHGGRYKGMMDCLERSVKKAGISCLFRGTAITMWRAFPVNAITFLVYSQLLNELNLVNPPMRLRVKTESADEDGGENVTDGQPEIQSEGIESVTSEDNPQLVEVNRGEEYSA